MSKVRRLYRSTLIAAALGALSLGAATAAEVHEQGWRGEAERGWQPRPPSHWYRHGYRQDRGEGHGEGYREWRYASPYRDCELPFAAAHYAPRRFARPYAPRLVIELPAPF